MAKFSRPFLVEKRLLKLEESFRLDTQKLRQKLIAELETIFDEAVKMARGEVTVAGKELTLRARRAWAKVASYTAQVIQGIARGFDEQEINVQLAELKKKIEEAKALIDEAKSRRA